MNIDIIILILSKCVYNINTRAIFIESEYTGSDCPKNENPKKKINDIIISNMWSVERLELKPSLYYKINIIHS